MTTPETRVQLAPVVERPTAECFSPAAGVSGTPLRERIAGLLREHALPVAFPTRRSSDVQGFTDVSHHATERD